jgi:hypothetical protein
MALDTGLAIKTHYLQVQALTPETPLTVPPSSAPTTNAITDILASGGLPLSLGIFFVLLTVGIIALLVTKVQDFNKILTISFLALVTSAIPYGTKLATETTRLQSRASIVSIPKNVEVSNVTATGFDVMWQTDTPNSGALRLRSDQDKKSAQTVYQEPDTDPITSHKISLTNLDPQTTYYFELLSGSVWFNQNGKPLVVATTSP